MKCLEGFDVVKWILIDLGDVIIYVFYKEECFYYNLEKFWGDVLFVDVFVVFIF